MKEKIISRVRKIIDMGQNGSKFRYDNQICEKREEKNHNNAS